jgi:hypothetical protein
MKRRLIIGLLFFCSVSWGQYQTTNLDFLFNGSIAVNGSDTLLVDSITGVFDVDYKLTFIDFDITLGYLPLKSKATLIMYGDTVPLICLGGVGLRNYNTADTLFIQKLDKTLKSDNKEDKPVRIKRIAHYSTATTDINDYWQALNYVSVLDVCPSGCTYSSIDAAASAASINDTIIVYSGIYNESGAQGGVFVDTDGLKFIALGASDIYATGTYATYISTADNVKFNGFSIINEVGNYCNRSVGTTTNLSYDNCWFDGLSHVALSTVENSSYTAFWNECYINDRIDYRTTYQVNDSKINGDERVFLTGADQTVPTLNYCDFNETTIGAIRLVVSTDLNVNYCTFKGIVITDSGVETGPRYFRGCLIEKIDDNSPMIFDNSGGDIFVDQCYFIDNYKLGLNPIFKITDHNIFIDSSAMLLVIRVFSLQ